MAKLRVPFPRYLNSKRLFYKWEYDVVIVAAFASLVIFVVVFLFGVPILFDIPIALAFGYFVRRYYEKFFKKVRKGYLYHLFYEFGYIDPIARRFIEDDYEKDMIPKGYEHEFKG